MQPALGSLNTMTPAFDAKQKQNENAANDRKLRNPNTPAERFVMPGQQQVQAMANARQGFDAQQSQQTFASMQKQGVARPAPPQMANRNRLPNAFQRVFNKMQAQKNPQYQPVAPVQSGQELQQRLDNALSQTGQQVGQIDFQKLEDVRSQTQAAMGQQPVAPGLSEQQMQQEQ